MNRKTLLLSLGLFVATSVCAQTMKIYKGDVLVKEYSAEEADAVIFCEEEVPHNFVEIGGVKWATMNIGATSVAGSPAECYGDYYAWGETKPRYTSLTITAQNNATVGSWTEEHPEGYSTNDYPDYTEDTLDAEHDAATKNWGSSWRMPTKAEFQALVTACTGSTGIQHTETIETSTPEGGIYWLTSSQNYLPEYQGVPGMLFIDKEDTTKRVFFPGAGYFYGDKLAIAGVTGFYWASEIDPDGGRWGAYYMCFDPQSVSPENSYLRCHGYTVRPVKNE